MRPSRIALALLVLTTLVIGMPLQSHARLFDDDSAGAAYDDLGGPPCLAAAPIELAPPTRVAVPVAPALRDATTSSAPIDVLVSAPKTSPPASRS